MQKIFPVLLCGGSGTRLWPLSRKSYPKQFVPLVGGETLFQSSARRLSGSASGISFAAPLVVTGSDFRFIVTEQLHDIGVDPGAILIEPDSRNTAPAVLAAALHLEAQDRDAMMLVAPSDHVIPDSSAFQTAVAQGVPAVLQGELVTFGVRPTRPETGYGYLELAAPLDGAGAPVKLARFVEKPDAERATQMLASGRFMWNAGVFLGKAADIIAAFEAYAPQLMAPVKASLGAAREDLGFLRLEAAAWQDADNISIDYAVMEHAKNLSVVPFTSQWSDLGGWDAVWRVSDQDDCGVALSGEATAIGCENTLLRADSDQLHIVGIGLKNIMAIAMNDAVLVADMDKAQDVKKAVSVLNATGASQATQFPKEHRPWGWFERLVAGPCFQVKRITVHPGAALSLQKHFHRSEHWVFVEGTARVTVEDQIQLVTENQSVYIPLGAVHRLENSGDVPLVLIEVQTGAYVGEDDIVRFDDMYSRGPGAKS